MKRYLIERTFPNGPSPSPEAIRNAAERSGLPVHTIPPVTVLDPYFYMAA